ncbi:MAG: hypothetical protein ACHREM_27120, partial [Polyangiales bacterium]
TSTTGQRLPFRAADGIDAVVDQIRDRLRARVAAHVPNAPHVIERQIVVIRCRFCAALTPVDLAECRACGGQAGGL